jgi:small subunit ribosomal protein S6
MIREEVINIRTYESIFILRPNLTDEEVEKAIAKMKGVIEKSGGEILNTENWKKRRLAYEVAKEKKGVYIVLQFKGNGKSINELERAYKIDDSVIKYLSIKLDGIKPKAAKEAVPEEKKEV